MVAVAPGVAAAANEADASISSVSRQTVAEPRRGASCHANVSESSSTPLSSNDAPTTSGSETGSQEGSKRPHPLPAKSCKGCLYFSNMRAARGGKPLCIGLSRKEEEQELRGPDAGKERQARQEFKYACVGYSVWEDGTSGSGPEAGAHMPAVLCTGLEFIATKDSQEATSPSTPSASTQGDRRKDSPFPTPQPTNPFPTEDFRLRFQRSAGRLAEHTFNNMQKIGTRLKESVSSMLSQDKDRPKS